MIDWWSLKKKHLSFWTKQSTVSIICSTQYGSISNNKDAQLLHTNKLTVVSGTKVLFFLFFFSLVFNLSVLLHISFHPTCIFQYTTAVTFVFIVLFLIVIVLTAVPPL